MQTGIARAEQITLSCVSRLTSAGVALRLQGDVMRRSISALCLLFCFTTFLIAQDATKTEVHFIGDPMKEFRTVDVAPGVFVFLSPEPGKGVVSGNSTVIEGDDGLVVVDTGHFPSVTR